MHFSYHAKQIWGMQQQIAYRQIQAKTKGGCFPIEGYPSSQWRQPILMNLLA